MVGEAVRVPENAATDHETVYFGVLRVELTDMGEIFDVAIHDELGGGAEIVAEFDYCRDELVVSRDFGHFFLGAKVNGEGGRMLS